MQHGSTHQDQVPSKPTLDVETQVSLSEALLELADLSIEGGRADALAILDRIAVSLITYMSDAEVSFIILSEYLDSARSCVQDGVDPYREPSTIHERQAFEDDLAAARRKAATDAKGSGRSGASDEAGESVA
ncbi:MAG: hypothetical protein GXY03_10920 [Solirubrobacterales bacterium]|nr:hypothetical protein [Solirubrobacterales bacterium]